MANRHGLISGATGTGKTVTLQVLAESFSRLGVPVFTADVKGDLSGLAAAGKEHPKIEERTSILSMKDFRFERNPLVFWDLYGKSGHPIRTTITEFGPLLLSRLLDLNETQEGVLYIAFKIADEQGLLLLDLKDLQSLLSWMADNRAEISKNYGNVSTQSVGAIQRRLLVLEENGAEQFFGEPALKLEHLMQTDFSGRGVISVLDARQLIEYPQLYSTFLLWLLSELFEELPEVGDASLPKMVFFFDEAHLLFDRAPRILLDKIEQVVRLIRSKGVGIFFCTQHPLDVPDTVLGQLGCKVQHALRAFTAKDRKALKSAAETFRENPAINTLETLTNLGVGEALVSSLNDKGQPAIVQQVLIRPPASRIGPIADEDRTVILSKSPLKGLYDEAVDRESAHEILQKRKEEELKNKPKDDEQKSPSKRQSAFEAFFKSLFRSIGYQIGRQISRGILGSVSKR